MSLLDEVRELLDQQVESFRVYGEDLIVMTPDRLARAASRHQQELEKRVPQSLREPLIRAQRDVLTQAHTFVVRYGASIHTRIRGYLVLGERMKFEYPWPVVAVLGLHEVLRSLVRVHGLGVVAFGLARVGIPALSERIERVDDVLRRTNRGIFLDSVPTVLYALHALELERAGESAVSRLMLEGSCPIVMDEHALGLARSLVAGLRMEDPETRFAALAELTLVHFAREQAVFSHHLGARRAPVGRLERLLSARHIVAPRVEGRPGERRLVFRPSPLPAGFDLLDHDARVRVFGEAFVSSVTRSREDYRVAQRWVTDHYGRRK